MPPQPDLEDVLGGPPPDGVGALPDDVRRRLAGHVETARLRQTEAMSAAVDAAVRGVPLPVRGLVKKALLG